MNKSPLSLTLLGILACAGASSSPASAQDLTVRLPKDPANYVIKFKEPETPAADGSAPTAPPEESLGLIETAIDPKTGKAIVGPKVLLQIHVMRSKGWQRNVCKWNDGSETENWLKGQLYITQNEEGKWVNIIDLAANILYKMDQPLTLPNAFAWANASTYRGEEQRGGKDTLVFERSTSEVKEKLWVDKETRLPLALQTPAGLCRFEFRSAEGLTLNLPPAHAKELEQYTALSQSPKRAPH